MHVLNTFLTSILYFILLNQTHYHFYTNAPGAQCQNCHSFGRKYIPFRSKKLFVNNIYDAYLRIAERMQTFDFWPSVGHGEWPIVGGEWRTHMLCKFFIQTLAYQVWSQNMIFLKFEIEMKIIYNIQLWKALSSMVWHGLLIGDHFKPRSTIAHVLIIPQKTRLHLSLTGLYFALNGDWLLCQMEIRQSHPFLN